MQMALQRCPPALVVITIVKVLIMIVRLPINLILAWAAFCLILSYFTPYAIWVYLAGAIGTLTAVLLCCPAKLAAMY